MVLVRSLRAVWVAAALLIGLCGSAEVVIARVESRAHTHKGPRGKEGEIEDRASGIRVELMHRDHVESPLRSASDLVGVERIRHDVLQTAAREEVLHRRLRKTAVQPAEARPSRKALQVQVSVTESIALPVGERWRLHIQGEETAGEVGYESTVSMTGAGYSMKISIGTPPQTFHAFADTGSDLPWVQCIPCKRCFVQADQFFDPKQSATYRPLSCSSKICQRLKEQQNYAGCRPGCRYSYFYGDQTHTNGDMALESLTILTTDGGSLTVPRFAFGCGHDNVGSLNQTGASGIIGLGRGRFSFPSQLRPYIGSKFSTCFVNRELASQKTSPLLFGDSAAVSVPGMQYTPMVSGNYSAATFYYVNVEGISVGDKRIDIAQSKAAFSIDPGTGEGGTILDSGSTLTSLVKHVYYRVMHEFLVQAPMYPQVNFNKYGLDLCFEVSKIADPKLPTLTFHLTNATWTMPQENIALVMRDGNDGVYMCVALTQSKFGVNIIGNIQQQDFQIVYDLANSQIGFAKVKCDTL
ncbi:aspartyl protease family protein [Marchantia polymorpha subsp. ruderalis]|uniref:Peptidase A1 domain-containing protein n=2 Tax=Marchantia polymorpha TaxID=3197 RepID=A0AAF6B329_MARPO|nr:hypothetical protein MARPO_0159s0023 [Marchantia polymorpha]BBN06413.1 hypothetical protein Mp_3g20930 [Marchantia polymorpha subsp. ruderalis]|eukprot:PTQ28609.1 hypothetical protein MARPO_0159s0023 [Marchantia polymorpha]